MKFRKHFDYDVEDASDSSAVSFIGQESLTVQSHAEDADLNVLMHRYGITGQMPENPKIPMYGDFSDVVDYQTALNAVASAYDGFMELPARVRARFNNDPQKLLAFCADDANLEEAQRLGLLKEKADGSASGSREGGSGVSGAGGSAPASGGAKSGDSSGQPAVPGGSSKTPGV